MMPFTPGPATTRQTWSDNGKTKRSWTMFIFCLVGRLSDRRRGGCRGGLLAARLFDTGRQIKVLQETVSAFPSPTREFGCCFAGGTSSHSVNTLPAKHLCLVVVLLWCENTIRITVYQFIFILRVGFWNTDWQYNHKDLLYSGELNFCKLSGLF